MSSIFERPDPVMVSIELSHYEELVKKATLYDALKSGELALIRNPKIIGGDKNE